MQEVYTVPARGIGTKDYSIQIEHFTTPFITTSFKQAQVAASANYIIPTLPFPFGFVLHMTLPQEDGTWAYEASTIPIYFYNVRASVRENYLSAVGLYRYANLADAIAGILAERFAVKFGYGSSEITFLKGIRTTPGSVYGIFFGCWSGAPHEITVGLNGLASEMTSPWWM